MLKTNLSLVYTATFEWLNDENKEVFSVYFKERGDRDKFKSSAEKILGEELSIKPINTQYRNQPYSLPYFVNMSHQSINLIREHLIKNEENLEIKFKNIIKNMIPDKIHGVDIYRVILNDEKEFNKIINELERKGLHILEPYSFNNRRNFLRDNDKGKILVEPIRNFGDKAYGESLHFLRINSIGYDKLCQEIGLTIREIS